MRRCLSLALSAFVLTACHPVDRDGSWNAIIPSIAGCYQNPLENGGYDAVILSDKTIRIHETIQKFEIVKSKIGYYVLPAKDIYWDRLGGGVVRLGGPHGGMIAIDSDLRGFQLTNAGAAGHFQRVACTPRQ